MHEVVLCGQGQSTFLEKTAAFLSIFKYWPKSHIFKMVVANVAPKLLHMHGKLDIALDLTRYKDATV